MVLLIFNITIKYKSFFIYFKLLLKGPTKLDHISRQHIFSDPKGSQLTCLASSKSNKWWTKCFHSKDFEVCLKDVCNWVNIPEFVNILLANNINKHAGAELYQAQVKLGKPASLLNLTLKVFLVEMFT